MAFPTTSGELLPLLEKLGQPREVLDVQLKVNRSGRLFFAVTTMATVDGELLVDTDGEPWTTTTYVPFDRFSDGQG